MIKSKRKRVGETHINHDPTYQSRCRLALEQEIMKGTEPNNNYINETDNAPLASRKKIDFTSDIMKPKTEGFNKLTSRMSEESILERTNIKDVPVSDPRVVSLDSWLEEMDLLLDSIKSKEDHTGNPTGMMEINNNPSHDDDKIPSTCQVGTNLIPKPKAKYTGKARGRPSKKTEIDELKIVVDNDATNPTRDTPSDSRLEINSISDKDKSETNLPCKLEALLDDKLLKSELLQNNDTSDSKTDCADTPLRNKVHIDSTLQPKAIYTCKPRGRPPRKITKSVEMVADRNPICEATVTSSNSWPEIDSIAEEAKPKKTRGRKPRGPQHQTPITSEPMEMNNNPKFNDNDTLLVNVSPTDILQSKPLKARGRIPRKGIQSEPMGMNIITSKCENKDMLLVDQVQTDLISSAAKPKIKRIRKSKAKWPQVLTTPDTVIESPCSLVIETKDIPSGNSSANEPSPVITMSEIKPNTKKSRGRKKVEDFDKHEINNNPAEFSIPLTICSHANSVLETPKIEENAILKLEEKSPGMQSKTDSLVVQTTERINSSQTNKTKNLVLEKLDLCSSIPQMVANKDLLLDKTYQPKVLLCDIAYSDKLSPQQKNMLIKNNKSRNYHSLENIPDSSMKQNTEQLTQHDSTISLELRETNDESIEGISNARAHDYEDSNSRKCKIHKKEQIIPESNVLELKRWDNMYTTKLSVRGLETNSNNASNTDVLSSVGNGEFNLRHKFSPSARLFSKQSSLSQHIDCSKSLTESVASSELEIPMLPLPEMEIPLDLSIRSSEKSIGNQSDFPKFNDSSIGEISCGDNSHQPQNTNIHNIKFDSSTFSVTDLDTSFTKIEAGLDSIISENLSEGDTRNNACRNSTSQESEYQVKKLAFHAPLQSVDKVFPSVSAASKSITKRVSTNSEKSTYRKDISIKISLPAEHYFSSQLTTPKKSNTVIEPKKVTAKTTLTQSRSLNRTDYRRSQNITYSISNREPGIKSLITTKPQRSTGANSHQCIELPTLLPDTCTIDEVNISSEETPTGYNINATVSGATFSGSIKKPTMSNIRSLPKIVTDELLPKGSITLSPVSHESTMPCMFSSEKRSKTHSNNVDEIDGNNETAQITIDQQSTYNSIVNVSQSHCRIIANSWNQTYGSTDRGNTDDGREGVDSPTEINNSHGINGKTFPEKMQVDLSSVVVGQHFDSTQLWRICPELEKYFSPDDIVNNNSDNKVSNFDTVNTVQTDGNDSIVHTLSAEMETDANVVDSTRLSSNNITLNITERNVVAANASHNKMKVESSESVANNNVSNSTQLPVIANLTTANLRNFNSISNRNGIKGELNWPSETCQNYVSHEDIAGHSKEPSPDVNVETSCEATESTSGSQKEFFQVEIKKRKRRWIESERYKSVRPSNEKRLKLNRSKWNTDGQDFGNLVNSSKLTSVGSINFNQSMTLNITENTLLPENNSFEKLDAVEPKIKDELNVDEKDKEIRQGIYDCKPKKVDEKIENCTEMSEKKPNDILSTVPTNTEDSGSPNRKFGIDSNLQEELSARSPQNDDSNNSIDSNENLTSMSSSSSSPSQDSKTMCNLDGSSHSKDSNKNKPEEDGPKSDKNQCQKEEIEDELDGDCISLFAESMFTNFDQATNLEDVSLSPLFDDTKDSEEKFQDMANVGAYFDENVQECNEAYEFCLQENENITNAFSDENCGRIIPQQLEANVNQLNLNQSVRCFERELYPQSTMAQKPNLSSIANLNHKLDIQTEASNAFFPYIESLFKRHCYRKLKQGSCTRENCHYYHYLAPSLQNLEQKDPQLINEVINYAILKGYEYFTQHIYTQIAMNIDYVNTMKLFSKLYNNGLINDYLVERTIIAVTEAGISLRQFLSDIAHLLNENDITLAACVINAASNIIEPGTYWDTCRDFLVRVTPPNLSINPVINECIFNDHKLHIEDVYLNFVKRLTMDQVASINVNLKEQFDLLLVKYNLIHDAENMSQLPLPENVDPVNRTLTMYPSENDNTNHIEISSILSPDDIANYTHNNSQYLPGSKQVVQKFSVEKPFAAQLLTKNEKTESNNKAKNRNLSHHKKGVATQVSSMVKQDSPDVDVGTSEINAAANSFDSSYKLYPIDDLLPPQSSFRDRHWKFHLALSNLKEALKHHEYPFALKILDRYSNMDASIFASSCYKILRDTVAASAHHVRNMIKLSVRIGVNKFLNETLSTLGIYMMIELCNANAWVLAYRLFKSLQYSTSFTDNIAAFALISAEICLANRRPLKAFIILKQNNMFCTRRSKWHISNNLNEENVKLKIISLLLDVLSQEYPDQAFYIFTYLLRDQTRIYHPIDLTAYIDKFVIAVLSGKYNNIITDVGKMIIENNFILKNSIFQSLVVNIFERDITLCRQLYCYGTWLGIYPIVKLSLPLHVLIKTNWTKEEMYLVIIDFLEKLAMDIGPTLDYIGPNQFTIHLVFELMPFKRKLPENDQISNKDELEMSKDLMKTVLREQFNPSLRTIIAERDRFMKLQSRSVIEYLKWMIVQK